MRHTKWILFPLFSVAVSLATAQQPKNFKVRLSPVPIDVAMQATIAGTGSAAATLSGAKLSITGTFEGLRSPATIAQLHKGPVRGTRGPVVFALTVTKTDDSSGGFSGSFDLTPAQVADLEGGRLYLQIHSEKAPDGNLWGWLLPQENKR